MDVVEMAGTRTCTAMAAEACEVAEEDAEPVATATPLKETALVEAEDEAVVVVCRTRPVGTQQ